MIAPEVIKNLRSAMRNKRNLLLIGPPGCGKTQMVEQAAKAEDMDFHEGNPSVKDPTDFKGVYGISNDEAKVFPLPDLKKMINAKRPLVVNLDDISWASLGVQAPVLALIQSRQIDGVPISEHTRFIVTSNRRKDGPGSQLLNPLINRCCTIEMTPSVPAWVKHFAIPKKLPMEVISFVKFKEKDILDQINNVVPSKDIQPFVSFRSLEMLANWFSDGARDIDIFRGCIGQSLGTEFASYWQIFNELGNLPQKIVQDPDSADIPQRPDLQFALMGKLAHSANRVSFPAFVRYSKRISPMMRNSFMVDTIDIDNKKGEAKSSDFQDFTHTTEHIEWNCEVNV